MALPGTGIVNQGLARIGTNASAVGGAGAVGSNQTISRYVAAMGFDDNASNFAATDTAQNTRGALTNFVAQLLDAFATIAGQTVSHTCTLGTGTFNGVTIKGIALHDQGSPLPTASSTTLFAGIANQSILKQSSFSLAVTVTVQYSDNS